MYDAASASILRTSARSPTNKVSPCPWWTDDCKIAVSRRRRARRLLLRHLSRDQLIEYKRRSAEARHCIIQGKRAYKRSFLSSITFTTPLGVAWKKVKLLRTTPTNSVYLIAEGGQLLPSILDKANLFYRTFQAQGMVGNIRVPENLHQIIVDS